MRIRILDPHWKKMDPDPNPDLRPDPDPDPGYFLKIYWHFLTKQKILIFCLIFFCLTIQKLGNFYILSFFNSSDLGFEIKIFFVAVFGWYFAPWIRIRGSAYFCGSGSRKPKSWIRILSTALNESIVFATNSDFLSALWNPMLSTLDVLNYELC